MVTSGTLEDILFSSRRRHTRLVSDWSSDVCSSDLRYLPLELFERPKMGFGIPVGRWFAGPLRDWGQSLLQEDRLRQDGFLNVAAVQRLWKEHLSGARSLEPQLWGGLMFQSWMEGRAESLLEKVSCISVSQLHASASS